MTSLVVLGIVALILLWGIFLYNRFVSLTNNSKEAWADIDTQLKRRYDLIPNLIETVKGYAAHEKQTFDEVVEARAKATSLQFDVSKVTPEQIHAFEGAEVGLSSALGKLLAVAENYPDLKANQNFLDLQRELSDTENKIQAARRFYNSNVRDLKTALQQFPGNIIGNMFGFKGMEFFELGAEDQVAKNPVAVKF